MARKRRLKTHDLQNEHEPTLKPSVALRESNVDVLTMATWYRPNTSRGLCMCGCGRPTALAVKNSKRDGTVKGMPRRYLQNHHLGGDQVAKVERDGDVFWTCRDCDSTKPLTEFPSSGVRRCVGCHNVVKRAKAEADVLRRYGLTVEARDAMLQAQGGVCAICRRTPERFMLDHDHDTGTARGLLCNRCNLGLGQFGDSIDTLMSAVAYLLERDGS